MKTSKKSDEIRQWLIRQISGMESGQYLASESDLAGKWGVSTRTIRRILTRLRDEKRVERITERKKRNR